MALSKITTESLLDGEITTAKFATGVGGKILQVVSTQGAFNTDGVSNNSFTDSAFTSAITPTASNSRIMVMLDFVMRITNSSGDGGCSIRLKQAISGGATTYPETLSSGIPSGNHHSFAYISGAFTGNQYRPESLHGVTSPNTTSAITYTVQYSTYNLEGFAIGGTDGKNTITMIEIGA